MLSDVDHNVLTGRTVSWQSFNPALATVTSSGLITALAIGQVMISAISGAKINNLTITVSQKPATSVTITPANGSAVLPQRAQLATEARGRSGALISGKPSDWQSSNPAVASVSAPTPGGLTVVPGLVGFGTATRAGRGGAVYRVTNLNDSGAGSLRAAATATGSRVVIFEISGTIRLRSKIIIKNPYITVAGQTAPAPGILLRNHGISVRTHDVLVQHLRIRGTGDDVEILGRGAYNVVVDHFSVSWSTDEDASTWYGDTHDITFSNAIFTENIGSGAVLVGDSTRNFALVGSLFVNNQDRNPYLKGYTTSVFANNVVYNWGGYQATYLGDPEGSGPQQASVVGNVYRRGPSTQPGRPIQVFSAVKAGTRLYVADNSDNATNGGAPPADPWSLVRNDEGGSVVASSPPVWPAGLTARPNGRVFAAVLANAGAYPAFRDAVDARAVRDARNGTGRMPKRAGVFPRLAVHRRALTLPANPNGDDDRDGYTNLEEWLHGMARTAEGR